MVPQKLCPMKIIGAGNRDSLMWMLVLRMLQELLLFKKVTG